MLKVSVFLALLKAAHCAEPEDWAATNPVEQTEAVVDVAQEGEMPVGSTAVSKEDEKQSAPDALNPEMKQLADALELEQVAANAIKRLLSEQAERKRALEAKVQRLERETAVATRQKDLAQKVRDEQKGMGLLRTDVKECMEKMMPQTKIKHIDYLQATEEQVTAALAQMDDFDVRLKELEKEMQDHFANLSPDGSGANAGQASPSSDGGQGHLQALIETNRPEPYPSVDRYIAARKLKPLLLRDFSVARYVGEYKVQDGYRGALVELLKSIRGDILPKSERSMSEYVKHMIKEADGLNKALDGAEAELAGWESGEEVLKQKRKLAEHEASVEDLRRQISSIEQAEREKKEAKIAKILELTRELSSHDTLISHCEAYTAPVNDDSKTGHGCAPSVTSTEAPGTSAGDVADADTTADTATEVTVDEGMNAVSQKNLEEQLPTLLENRENFDASMVLSQDDRARLEAEIKRIQDQIEENKMRKTYLNIEMEKRKASEKNRSQKEAKHKKWEAGQPCDDLDRFVREKMQPSDFLDRAKELYEAKRRETESYVEQCNATGMPVEQENIWQGLRSCVPGKGCADRVTAYREQVVEPAFQEVDSDLQKQLAARQAELLKVTQLVEQKARANDVNERMIHALQSAAVQPEVRLPSVDASTKNNFLKGIRRGIAARGGAWWGNIF